MDVAASATALAVIDVAKTKNKIVVLNGPGAARITNEACTPVSIHYTYDNYALAAELNDKGRAIEAVKFSKLCVAGADGPFRDLALKNLEALRNEYNLE